MFDQEYEGLRLECLALQEFFELIYFKKNHKFFRSFQCKHLQLQMKTAKKSTFLFEM